MGSEREICHHDNYNILYVRYTGCCKRTNVIWILVYFGGFLAQYREILEVSCSKMTLEFTLCGEGIEPLITCTHEGRILDFGYVLEKQSSSQVLTVTP